MSTKHTPAPWFVEGNTIYALEHYGWRKGEEQFCNRFTASIGRGQKNNDGELLANAQLISAAPELLEALKISQKLLKNITPYKGQEELLSGSIELNDLVIAKALGEPS